MDQQVKVRGYRIELGEIEFVLREHHAVIDAAVTVIDQDGVGKRIVAYVVYVEGASTTVGDLRDFLKAKLPDYMIPHIFLQLDSLPRTPNSKLDRRRLPEPGAVLNEREKVARILARLRQLSDEDADKEAKALLAQRRMSI
jgi:acyl-coenzyme A synthetase/AMP-(fatty) acid ligase